MPLSLQLQFIETLLVSCLGGQECFNQFIAASNYENNFVPSQPNSSASDSNTDGNSKEGCNIMKQKEWTESIGKWFNKDDISRFAISLYLRWIIRSLQKINLPLPPINKQQIYSTSGLPGCNFAPTVIDPNIAAQITSTIPCALKILETELDKNRSLNQSQPGYESFSIKKEENIPHSNLEVKCADDNSLHLQIEKGGWRCMILFDLATYYFYTENYSKCRKYLKCIKQLQVGSLQQILNIDIFNGFTIAVGGEIENKEDQSLKRGKEDKSAIVSDDIADALKKVESNNGIESYFKTTKDIPKYRRINAELAAVFKGGNNNPSIAKALEKLIEANIAMRLKEGLPQNSEFFRSGYKILNSSGSFSKQKDQKLFLQYLSGIKKLDYSKEPIDVDVEKPWNRIKHAKLKKRDILLSLLREMQKPEKIYKLLQDLTKITSGSAPLFINRMIPRYSNSDGGQIVDLYVGASNGASSQQQQLDSNYVFILMAKANQLVELKAFDEAVNFYTSVSRHVENSCSNKQQANIIQQHINIQILYTKMLQLADERYNILLTSDDNRRKLKYCSNSALSLELSNKLKECVIIIAANCQENVFHIQLGSFQLLETAFVTLLNLGEFDFVLGSCRKEGAGPGGKLYQFRNLVNIASLISSGILHIRNQIKQTQSGSRLNGNLANASDAVDFKKTCKGLYEILLPCVQTSVTATKRGRGGNDISGGASKSSRDKSWYLHFLKRLHHTEILTMLASFFISIYNASVEDSSHEIQLGSSGSDLGLPTLPISHNSSADINEDSVLSLITWISSKGSKNALTQGVPWVRIQAEVNFAQGNYLAALRFYIQSLMLTTHYFQKPWTKDNVTSMNIVSGENSASNPLSLAFSQNSTLGSSNSVLATGGNGWDDRIFHKMIKCTTELGHHATTVVLCQFLGTDSADYPTAFRSLEDRGSNDCMDDMYPFLWDVTALEYTVSMHTKRGELSRKRKALETISQLEINTNNNEEILREARATRRSAFLRYMAAAFL